MLELVTPIVLIAGVAVLTLAQLGLLPERSTTAHWRGRAEHAEDALAAVTEANEKLRQERTNEPVLHVIAQVLARVDDCTRIQAETLERFASFNGSLKHVEQGLRDATNGMQTMVGLIAELHDLPVKPPR